jgi:hypothetical protein
MLTTNASKIAIVANLSQVQGGIERPFAYASRQLNTPERSYSASELEMLALIWATEYFSCYTYGKRFLVRTDHAALVYLQNFSSQIGRLLRWSLKLAQLDFVVEHKAGSKIGHVDALSRHVVTVSNPGRLSKENFSREQKADVFCCKRNPTSYRSKSAFF